MQHDCIGPCFQTYFVLSECNVTSSLFNSGQMNGPARFVQLSIHVCRFRMTIVRYHVPLRWLRHLVQLHWRINIAIMFLTDFFFTNLLRTSLAHATYDVH